MLFRSYDEALKMQEVQHETGKILNIGVVNRFNDQVNRIRSYIKEGRLGEVYHIYLSFRSHRSIPGLGGAFTTREIAGGGALIDWGVHFLDLVMYCMDDPRPVTVSGETFCRLGKDIEGYTYKDMWAGPPDPAGVYDVEDSVAALIRTDGPVLTLHGAWAQNIGETEMLVDFMGPICHLPSDLWGIRTDVRVLPLIIAQYEFLIHWLLYCIKKPHQVVRLKFEFRKNPQILWIFYFADS